MTKLTIRWENNEGYHKEETWEGGNDGILYSLFDTITKLMHLMRRLKDEM